MSKYSVVSLKQRKKMLYVYSTFLFVLALSIAFMPISSMVKEDINILLYCTGASFWIGIIGTIFMAVKINYCRRVHVHFNGQNIKLKQCGLFHFFQNKKAMIADILLLVSIAGIVIDKIMIKNIFVLFIFSSSLLYSFGMHCMLNGINYKYINYQEERNENYESN